MIDKIINFMPDWSRWLLAAFVGITLDVVFNIPFVIAFGKNDIINNVYQSVIGNQLILIALYKMVPRAKRTVVLIAAAYFLLNGIVNEARLFIVENGNIEKAVSESFGIFISSVVIWRVWKRGSQKENSSRIAKMFFANKKINSVLKECIVFVGFIAVLLFVFTNISGIKDYQNVCGLIVVLVGFWFMAVFLQPVSIIWFIWLFTGASAYTLPLAWLSCFVMTIQMYVNYRREIGSKQNE